MILAEDDIQSQIMPVSKHNKIKKNKKCHNCNKHKKYNDWSKDPHWHSSRPSISLPYHNNYSRNYSYPMMDAIYPSYDMLDDGPGPMSGPMLDDRIPEISPSKVKKKNIYNYNNISNMILVIVLLLVVFMFLSERRYK